MLISYLLRPTKQGVEMADDTPLSMLAIGKICRQIGDLAVLASQLPKVTAEKADVTVQEAAVARMWALGKLAISVEELGTVLDDMGMGERIAAKYENLLALVYADSDVMRQDLAIDDEADAIRAISYAAMALRSITIDWFAVFKLPKVRFWHIVNLIEHITKMSQLAAYEPKDLSRDFRINDMDSARAIVNWAKSHIQSGKTVIGEVVIDEAAELNCSMIVGRDLKVVIY